MTPTNYFGTSALPVTIKLQAGLISCLYESGNLRYIRIDDTEVVRMIYSALRDDRWLTIPFDISNEVIDVQDDAFSISYKAIYHQDQVSYKAEIKITGAGNSISYSFKGTALNNFKRNRIGLCVLHPVKECIGKPCIIEHPGGEQSRLNFPDLINPHQPFKDVAAMQWQPDENIKATLQFEGDIFETEDQRNWTDASYKTYGTPMALPFPVEIKAGDTINQTITLEVDVLKQLPMADKPVAIAVTDNKFKFPKIGYGRSPEELTEKQIELLKDIHLDTYRFELHFDTDWQELFEHTVNEAKALQTCISISIFFTQPDRQLQELVAILKPHIDIIEDILILDADRKTTGADTMNKAYNLFKWIFPGIKIGAGTNGYFTDWNREPLIDTPFDFISYSINPQVHANDTRTLIENLEAQQYSIKKANVLNPDCPVHISPITLRSRKIPERKHDTRQTTLFTAAWTLLTFRYLAGAASLIFYEAAGPDGLLDCDKPYPVFDYLKIVKDFRPTHIIQTNSNKPLQADALVLQNKKGEVLAFLINFTEEPIEINFADNTQKMLLPAASITVKHN